MTELAELKLYERLAIAKENLEPIQSDYRVVFEADLDNTSSILVPDPNWLAAAICGGILPPVSVYHQLETDDQGRVTNGHILHETPPIEAMAEEEAIEYLIQKDIPDHIWAVKPGNAIKMVICRKNQLLANRQWRNAWKIKQESTNDNNLH